MVPASYNITYYRGDTFTLTVTVYDANGQELDMSQWTGVTFGLNKNRGAYTNTVALSASLNKSASQITCSISSSTGAGLSGSYFYDVTLYRKDTVNNVVTSEYTVMTGTLTVSDDVVNVSDIPGAL